MSMSAMRFNERELVRQIPISEDVDEQGLMEDRGVTDAGWFAQILCIRLPSRKIHERRCVVFIISKGVEETDPQT